ncbi:PAS domain S-box protein [Paucibacter sp. O1-1]|nr:PAS domain S-box protein [Paucibacter sp. O1-1]MDA3831272.1 PAS domain S-box protein [Paucibacter sp. O1-1]
MSALDAVSGPCFVHAGRTVLYANKAMLGLLGHAQPVLQAMPFFGWAAEDFQERLRYCGERCLIELAELPAMEVEAITVNGSRRFLELTTRRVTLDAGVVAVHSVLDLSDIRHVQTSLLDVGRVLHQIIENSPVAIFVMDAEHRITQWNAACAQLTGIESYDLLGTDSAWRAFYTEPRPLLADLILDGSLDPNGVRLYGGKCQPSSTIAGALEAEDFFPRFGANGRWLYFTAAPLLDAQGSVVGAIETLQDITERRTAQDELLRHRNELEGMVADRTAELLSTHHELEAFLENASVGIIATKNQRIVRGNGKFAELFELDGGSAYGIPTRQFFSSDEDFAELGRIAYPQLARGQSFSHEMELRTMKGNTLWVQLIAYVSNPEETASGTWWLLQDRTEVRRAHYELQRNYERIQQTNARLEEAQNQLLQSEKMASIGQLAAGVAHEINNPIGFVSSNLGTLRRYVSSMLDLLALFERMDLGSGSADDTAELQRLKKAVDLEFLREDLPQLLDESEDGLLRVKKIVQDLKDFSRVDQAEWQEADLNAGLDSTLNVVMNEVKYKAEVKKCYGQLPAVRCIAAQLNQVFMNLIINAAHAIPERGEITLLTATHEGWVSVEVRDTGVGMSDDVKRRIFEPFFTTKPVGMGTGLGLSLSFSIVQKHGGRIEVESLEGGGTTFRVWLPVRGPTPEVVPRT